MLLEIAREQGVEMIVSAFAFGERVGATRVLHKIERFPEFDEAVEEQFGALVVDIIVAGTVDDEQIAAKAFGKIDGGSGLVAGGIVFGRAHVAFLVDGVIEALVGDGSDAHTHLVKIG
jgi:hypothetical protein